jgi:DNA-binding winged helix-turn-helix (wHTH) protein
LVWLKHHRLVFTDPKETVDVALYSDMPPLHIVTGARIARIYGAPVPLTTLEYEQLLFLAQNPRKICTREICFAAVWHQPYDHATCEDALNACMARLRRNLCATAASIAGEPPQLATIRRIGFRRDTEAVMAEQDEPSLTPGTGRLGSSALVKVIGFRSRQAAKPQRESLSDASTSSVSTTPRSAEFDMARIVGRLSSDG